MFARARSHTCVGCRLLGGVGDAAAGFAPGVGYAGGKGGNYSADPRAMRSNDDRSTSQSSLGRTQRNTMARAGDRYISSASMNPFATSFSPFVLMRRMFDDMEQLMGVFGNPDR
ncbi:MAG: hypothetical protein AB7O24_01420 [Kofleriaceae bacterium]